MTGANVLSSLRGWAVAYLPPRLLHRYRMLRHVTIAPFEPELRFLNRFLGRDSVAFDIGANVGIYSDLLAARSRRVLAFEPHPGCAAALRRLALDRVEVIEAALADKTGEADLRIPQVSRADAHALSSLSAANAFDGLSVRVQRVAVLTLDAAMERYVAADERVGFVKIDVEGHELAVLRGGREFIARHRPVLMVETEFRHGADPAELLRLGAEDGYSAYAVLGEALEPVDAKILAEHQVPELAAAGRRGGYVNNVFLIPPSFDRSLLA